MIEKIRNGLGLCILMLFPIMQFISFAGIKFNVSVADFLIPAYLFLCLLDIKKFSIKRNIPFAAYFAAYIFVVVISNCYNFSTGVDTYGVAGLLSELVKIATCFGYFIVAYNSFEDDRSFSHVMVAWLIGLWIFMIYGFINLNGRFLGTFTDANGAGNYLTFSFFVMIPLMFRIKQDALRIAVYITEMMVLLCILATQSRGTWVGLAVGLSLLVIVFWKRLYGLLVFLIPLLVIATLIFVKIDFDSNYAMSSSITRRFNEAVDGEGQFVIRKNLSFQSLMMGADHPVIGVGKGNFNLNSTPYADLLYDNSKNEFIYKEMTRSIPHNTFAGIFAELGIVGFVVFSSAFAFWIFRLLKKPTYLNKVFLIAFLAFGVQSLVLCLENARVLWIFLAIGLRLQDVEIPFSVVDRDVSKFSLTSKGAILLAVAMGIAFLYTASHVTRYTEVTDTAAVFEINCQQGLKIIYDIKSISNIETASLSYVTLYRDTIGDENLICSKAYLDASGYEVIEVSDEEASLIQLVFQKEAGGELAIRNLYYETVDSKKRSLMDYIFVPNVIEAGLSAMLQIREYDQSKTINAESDGKMHLADYINDLDKDKLLLISAKDEASRNLDGATVAAFRSFEIDFKLPYKTRFSYAAVLSKADGFESFEAISETKMQEIKLNFEKGTSFGFYNLPFDLELAGAGYEAGNYSNIKLDGVEYSASNRGLNIVVYDMKENRVTEAFTVDTYFSSFYE